MAQRSAVYEVVLDHNDPGHHDAMARHARELKAWAAGHKATHLVREEQELRPGVFRLRFTAQRQTRFGADAFQRTS